VAPLQAEVARLAERVQNLQQLHSSELAAIESSARQQVAAAQSEAQAAVDRLSASGASMQQQLRGESQRSEGLAADLSRMQVGKCWQASRLTWWPGCSEEMLPVTAVVLLPVTGLFEPPCLAPPNPTFRPCTWAAGRAGKADAACCRQDGAAGQGGGPPQGAHQVSRAVCSGMPTPCLIPDLLPC